MFSSNGCSRVLANALIVFATSGVLLLSSPASAANGSLDAEGNEAVQAALFAWVLGQHPELAASPPLQWASREIEGLPGPMAPERPGMGPEQEDYLRAVSEAARTKAPPETVKIEIPASLHGQGDALRLSSQTDVIEGTAALSRLYLNWPRINASFQWVEQKPFFLPLPDDLVLPERERGNRVRHRTLLSVVLDMSDPVATVSGNSFRGVSAEARIRTVDLVFRTERLQEGAYVAEPDQILASWTRQEGDALDPQSAEPVDLPGLVELFGGAVNAGRYVPENDATSFLGNAIGATAGRIRNLGQVRSIETALAFGAILEAGNERTIGPEAAQTALRYILSEREAYDLFSVSYLTDYRNLNELQRRSELAQAEPRLRALIAARMPQLPLKVRNVVMAGVAEYDFDLQGFPIRAYSKGPWMARSPVTGREIEDLIPGFLPIPEADAKALLAKVERTNSMNRMVFIAVDYTLTEARARPGKSEAIRPEELPLVRLMSRIDGVTVYTDPELTDAVLVREHEAAAEAPKLLPDALFATTGKSLMGALASQPGGRDIVLQAASTFREVHRATPDQRDRIAQNITEEIAAAAREEYWIGATWQLGAFDEARGGFTVKSVAFHAVPHSEDISGIEAPELQVDPPGAIDVLRVDPGQRALVESYLDLARAKSAGGMRLSSHARILPVAAEQERGKPILRISAPIELLLGSTEGFGWPQTDDDRVQIVAPPAFGPAGNEAPEVVAPDVLMLDHEGVDLLAVSLAPDAYDDTAYRRMLIERLAREATLDATGDNQVQQPSVDWGRFFPKPSEPLTEETIGKLLPVFRDWTRARAAELPGMVSVPLSFAQPINPDSGCSGAREVVDVRIGKQNNAAYDNAESLIDGGAASSTFFRASNSLRPSFGEDRIWALLGGPGVHGGLGCSYTTHRGRIRDWSGLSAARYSDALVRIRTQPTLQANFNFTSATYVGEIESAAFRPIEPGSRDSPGLVGAVTLDVRPVSAVGHRQETSGQITYLDPLRREDWETPPVVAPASQDVVGLTLNMPLDDFLAGAREKIPDAVLFEPVRAGDGVFGNAVGLLNPETGEAIVGVYASGVEKQPVVAIMRRLELPSATTSTAGLRLSLLNKYGTPSEDGGEEGVIWGGLDKTEDPWGFCGGMAMLGGPGNQGFPLLQPAEKERLEHARQLLRPGFWVETGWPRDLSGDPASRLQDPERCGPVIASKIFDLGRKLLLSVWLFDRKLAELSESAPRPEVEASDVVL